MRGEYRERERGKGRRREKGEQVGYHDRSRRVAHDGDDECTKEPVYSRLVRQDHLEVLRRDVFVSLQKKRKKKETKRKRVEAEGARRKEEKLATSFDQSLLFILFSPPHFPSVPLPSLSLSSPHIQQISQ